MFRTLIGSAALTAAMAMPALAEIRAEPVPIDHFARIPNIQSVSMSAEGDTIAAIIAMPGSDNEETALATWDLDNPSAGPVVTPSGDRMKFIAADALKSDRVLVIGRQEWTGRLGGCGEGRVTGATETFVVKAYLTDTAHSDFEDAFADNTRAIGISEAMQRCFEIAGTANLVNSLPLEPHHVLVRQLNQTTLASNFYRYDLRDGSTELVYRESSSTGAAFINPRNGEVLVEQRFEPAGDDYTIDYLIKNPESGQFEVHEPLRSLASSRLTVSFEGIDEATGHYYVITDKFSDKAAVYMYDPVARTFGDEPLLAHPEFSATSVILGTDPSNFNQLLGFAYGGASIEVYWLDPTIASIQSGLEAAFPDIGVGLIDWNDDFSRVLFRTSDGAHPPTYYLLLDGERVTSLGASMPWFQDDELRKPELVYYEARDGLRIPAILTLPLGWTQEDGPLPAVVLPHGGPWARDSVAGDSTGWPQFLASRGYAVLQPQYRGSAGWGRELWLAGDAQWGLAMQDDKDDGAAWLVEQGIADPERIAIFGYSYGGFAAMAAVVRPNSPYQCAIAGAGVSNLTRIGNNWSDNRLQRVIQGNTVDGMDPMQHTDQANIPILIYHGDRDVRVPIFHAEDFYRAIRDRVDAELLVIEDMPHSLPWYPRHHRETLSAIEDYLANDCGPGGL